MKGLLLLTSLLGLSQGFHVLPTCQSRSCTTWRMANSNAATEATSSSSLTAPTVADPTNIRNVAFVGHSHAGKTALAEWMLYDDHVITKKPVTGSSMLDSDPVEAARHSSVFSHFVRVPHKSHLLEVSDTPWGDFPSSAYAAVDGSDAAVLVVSAADGVQSGTVHAFQHCHQAGIKSMVALSKMDRPFLQLEEVLLDLEMQLGIKPVPLQVPRGQGEDFSGVDSLFLVNAQGEVEKNPADGLEEAWTILEESVAMTDDNLMVAYLENERLDADQVVAGLRAAVRQDKILPLVYTSATQDLGVVELADVMVAVLPNPMELREDAIAAACESDEGMCGRVAGVESGFAARVIHTMVDSFGSLSVLRIISNSREGDDDDSAFETLPHEAINLRTGEKMKLPSAQAAFGLCGKERLALADGARVVPGDVIAVPKLPEDVRTNDILTDPSAVKEEEAEIVIESATNTLSPLSRPIEDVPLMASATISVVASESKGGKRKAGGASDDKLITALAAMAREDLAMRVDHDPSGKLLLHCMSGDHLQLVAARLNFRYGLEVELGRPPIQFRETLVKPVRSIEGKHKKQSGGSGQFGVCVIDMEPLGEGAGVEFESRIKGGVISKPFIASVEKGVREQLELGGPLAGYPVTDVKVTLVDGKMHSVDSKDIAFQSAGKQAVKAAMERGGSQFLQPMEQVTFTIDEHLQGEISTIVSRQDGYVTSTNPLENSSNLEVEAIIPTAGIAKVSDVLRAASAGEGHFVSELSHYQPVMEQSAIDDIVENSPRQKQKV